MRTQDMSTFDNETKLREVCVESGFENLPDRGNKNGTDLLADCLRALGWNFGSAHQVLAEIARLKAIEQTISSIPASSREQFIREFTRKTLGLGK